MAPAALAKGKRICILNRTQALQYEAYGIRHRCGGGKHIHLGKSHVEDLIAAGEMYWVDKKHGKAAYVEHKTWQKTRSGVVTTMQLKSGLRSRAVPAIHKA